MVEVRGNRCKVQREDGSVIDDVHMEDLLGVPDSISDPVKHLQFDDDDQELYVNGEGNSRSLGEMIEAKGKASEEKPPIEPGKLDKVSAGNFVVYRIRTKVCTIGKVTNMSRAKAPLSSIRTRRSQTCR